MATILGDAKIRVVLDLEEAKRQLAKERAAAGGPGAQPYAGKPAAPVSTSAPSPDRERITEASIERKRMLDDLQRYWQKRDAMFERVKARAAKLKVSGGTDEGDFSWIPGGAATSPIKSALGKIAGPELATLGKIGAIGAAGYAAASFAGSNVNTLIEAVKGLLPDAIKGSAALASVESSLEELRGSFIRLETAVASIMASAGTTMEQLSAGAFVTGQFPAAGDLWNMNWQVERNQRALDAKLTHERRDEVAKTLAPVLAKAFKGAFSR